MHELPFLFYNRGLEQIWYCGIFCRIQISEYQQKIKLYCILPAPSPPFRSLLKKKKKSPSLSTNSVAKAKHSTDLQVQQTCLRSTRPDKSFTFWDAPWRERTKGRQPTGETSTSTCVPMSTAFAESVVTSERVRGGWGVLLPFDICTCLDHRRTRIGGRLFLHRLTHLARGNQRLKLSR